MFTKLNNENSIGVEQKKCRSLAIVLLKSVSQLHYFQFYFLAPFYSLASLNLPLNLRYLIQTKWFSFSVF